MTDTAMHVSRIAVGTLLVTASLTSGEVDVLPVRNELLADKHIGTPRCLRLDMRFKMLYVSRVLALILPSVHVLDLHCSPRIWTNQDMGLSAMQSILNVECFLCVS